MGGGERHAHARERGPAGRDASSPARSHAAGAAVARTHQLALCPLLLDHIRVAEAEGRAKREGANEL